MGRTAKGGPDFPCILAKVVDSQACLTLCLLAFSLKSVAAKKQHLSCLVFFPLLPLAVPC